MGKIIKNKKIPKNQSGRPGIYEFEKMKIGDAKNLYFDTKSEAIKGRKRVITSANTRGYDITTRIFERSNDFKLTYWMQGTKQSRADRKRKILG